MFYTIDNGVLTRVNCEPQANPDVSGVGVRTSLYLQALFSILLSLGETSSKTIIATNIAVQVTTLSLIMAAYFDPEIDAPHTIMVTHYVTMASMIRITSNDFALRYLRTKDGLRAVTVIWLMDMVFRPILLIFNLTVWVCIRELQRQQPALCENGSGEWILFGQVKEISTADSGSEFAFAWVIMDVIWEGLRIIAGIARRLVLQKKGRLQVAKQSGFDARIWWVRKGCKNLLFLVNCSLGPFRDWEALCSVLFRLLLLFKAFIYAYTIWTVESMDQANNLVAGEEKWSFGQIFATASMLGSAIIFLLRCFRFIQKRWLRIYIIILKTLLVLCILGCIAAYATAMYKIKMAIRHKYLENPDEPPTHKSKFLYVLFTSLMVPFEKYIYHISFFLAPFVFAAVILILSCPIYFGLLIYHVLLASIWSYIDVEGLEDETEAEGESHELLPVAEPSQVASQVL